MTDNKKTAVATTVQESNKQIIAQPVKEFNPEEDIKQGQKAAKALMQVVEITKPLKLNGKTYLYFEHWQTMAKFFRMTVGTEWVKTIPNGFEAKAIVYHNGVVVGGAEASCMRDEVNWNKKPEFQLKSMAQTRAMSKALRSILGYIPVLAGIEATPAEEMDGVPSKPLPGPVQSTEYLCEVHGATVKHFDAGTSKSGKSYPAFWACTDKTNGYCKAQIVNQDHEPVRMNPDTGEMEIIKQPPYITGDYPA